MTLSDALALSRGLADGLCRDLERELGRQVDPAGCPAPHAVPLAGAWRRGQHEPRTLFYGPEAWPGRERPYAKLHVCTNGRGDAVAVVSVHTARGIPVHVEHLTGADRRLFVRRVCRILRGFAERVDGVTAESWEALS